MKRTIEVGLGLIAALIMTAGVTATSLADEYPSSAITMVVPFPPGGGADIIMRALGKELSTQMGQSIIIDNRPGAGGTIAATYAKNAKPDGYTLFFGNTSTHATNQHIMDLKYDPVVDFSPVSSLLIIPHVLVVPADSSVESVEDLVALADTKPNGLSFATQGLGAGGQILGEQFSKATGKSMLAIPYKGGGPALLDTSAGRTDFMFSGLPPVRSFLADGTLRILAVAGPERLSIMPDVKAMSELGYPEVNLNFWMAVFAPAGTPSEITEKIYKELVTAANSDAMTELVTKSSMRLQVNGAAALADQVKSDTKTVGDLLTGVGLKK
ncbi:Bug family tripartite tricarboxylate transporter substrate binding protein [Roseibium algae]|uniref:Tripartite tricarboxylate transporter substrate binding protein n=1 Tax=Roseibium algae TaxID=3123038 RepID=A0ABU8TRN4_9HYPH